MVFTSGAQLVNHKICTFRRETIPYRVAVCRPASLTGPEAPQRRKGGRAGALYGARLLRRFQEEL